MAKRAKRDFTQTAFDVVKRAAEGKPPVPESDPRATARRKNGERGGKSRATSLSVEERSEAARKAALARWAKSPTSKEGK